MKITTKAVAEIAPGADDGNSPTGTFDVILSAQTLDRDGDTLRSDEWKTPLPSRINFDTDHGMSVATTVGSGVPFINDNGDLQVRGTYSSLKQAQDVRTLVNEGHIWQTSVAFVTEKSTKAAGGVTRELLNGAFVAIPANPDAIVLSSKSGARNSKSDAEQIQAIHDATATLGANCAAATGESEGENSKSLRVKSVDEGAWDGSAANYTIEQWRAACLIGPSSQSDVKGDYKLPVKTPGGVVSRAGVHAAAGRIGQLKDVPAAQVAAAKAKLRSLYVNTLKEDPPASLKSFSAQSDDSDDTPEALAAATDAAIDEAVDLFNSVDTTTLPAEVQQAIALVLSADSSVDELLKVLGVPDPDEDDEDSSSKSITTADTDSAARAAEVKSAREIALRAQAAQLSLAANLLSL